MMLGSKVHNVMIPADFFAFHALEILKTSDSRIIDDKVGFVKYEPSEISSSQKDFP